MPSYDNDTAKNQPLRDEYPRPPAPADAPQPPTPTRGAKRPGGTVEALPPTRRRQR